MRGETNSANGWGGYFVGRGYFSDDLGIGTSPAVRLHVNGGVDAEPGSGGYIVAGYAFAHPTQIAGMAFIDVPTPFRDPPPPIVEETKWNHPSNVEQRDYLQVEKDALGSTKRGW